MHSQSPLRQAYYTYLGRLYAFAYGAGNRTYLGMTVRGWLTLAGLVLLAVAWVQRWPTWILILIVLAVAWVFVSFWLARRANYNRFVPDNNDLMATDELATLPPNERVAAQATGSFSVSGYGSNVLFRPAEYWQVPLGDHIVMVEERPKKFLYQFFSAATLQSVTSGWLLFGNEPREALAITFLSRWGPEYTKFQAYDDGEESTTPSKTVTIFLTFGSERDRDMVWQTIVSDARRVRA